MDLESIDLARITTNDILPDDEIVSLKSYKEQAVRELALLETEIALADLSLDAVDTDVPPTQRTLPAARKRRRQLLAIIRAITIAAAPYKTLPAELLSYIFTFAFTSPSTPTSSYSSTTPSSFPSQTPTQIPPTTTPPRFTPLTLTHTSSLWRSIAHSTPTLWTAVVFRQAPGLDPYRSLEMALEWFGRSGGSVLLELEVGRWMPGSGRRRGGSGGGRNHPHPHTQNRTQNHDRDRAREYDHGEVMNHVLERLIKPYAGRWRRVSVWFPERQLWEFVKTIKEVPFTGLRELGLGRDEYIPQHPDNEQWGWNGGEQWEWNWDDLLGVPPLPPTNNAGANNHNDAQGVRRRSRDRPPSRPPPLFISSAPNLTSITCDNLAHRVPSIDIFLCSRTLTHFSCTPSTPLSVAQAHAIFQHGKALVGCELSVDVLRREGYRELGLGVARPNDQKHREVENLRSLRVFFGAGGGRGGGHVGVEDGTTALIRALFDPLLLFPALVDLRLEVREEGTRGWGRTVWPVEVVRGMIERSGCVLDGLQVVGGVFRWPVEPSALALAESGSSTTSSTALGRNMRARNPITNANANANINTNINVITMFRTNANANTTTSSTALGRNMRARNPITNANANANININTNINVITMYRTNANANTTTTPLNPHRPTLSSLLHSLTFLNITLTNPLPRPVLEGIAHGTAMPNLRGLVCRLGAGDLELGVGVMERCAGRPCVFKESSRIEREREEPVCFMIEYEGALITRELAVRVDWLRGRGARIEMTHVQS